MEFIRKVVDQPNLCLSPITDNPYNDFQFELDKTIHNGYNVYYT